MHGYFWCKQIYWLFRTKYLFMYAHTHTHSLVITCKWFNSASSCTRNDLTFAVRVVLFDTVSMAFQCIQVFREVSCGAVHVVALSEEGLLQAWGNLHFLCSLVSAILCIVHPLDSFHELVQVYKSLFVISSFLVYILYQVTAIELNQYSLMF